MSNDSHDQDDDIFEFCLDQIDLDSDLNDQSRSLRYPSLPARPFSSPDQSDDPVFDQFDDALIPVDEPFSVGSLPRSSPTRSQKIQPRSEALAASLHLDGIKLRAMQSAFDQESSLHTHTNSHQPEWLDKLPSLPDMAKKTPDRLANIPQADIQDEEWGGAPFTVPSRHHRTDVAPRSTSKHLYDAKTLKLIGPKSSTFRAGFGPGLTMVCRGSSLTSIRILKVKHDGINPRLIDLHQKAVDNVEPLEDLAHSYKECSGDHWSLVIALFDPNFSGCNVHMRNSLSNWLESAVRSDQMQLMSDEILHHIVAQNRHIAGTDFWAEIASSLLGHSLADAVTVSIRHGNLRLATLIAENGSGLRGQSRQLLREQIKKWVISGTWQSFTETCQTVYRILAGDVCDAGWDWLSNLSAKFWFNEGPNEPLHSLLAPFSSSSYDIRRSLLQLRADPSMPTSKVFKGNPKYFDFALMWHMYDILSRRGIVLYGNASWDLRVCYIAQLEAANQFKSALYVAIVGSHENPVATKYLLQDLLLRNWPKSSSSNFVPVQFGVPAHSDSRPNNGRGSFLSAQESDFIDFIMHWTDKVHTRDLYDPKVLIYTAKFGRCMSDGNMPAAMTCAIKAGLWDAAYSIFITDIAPHLILTHNFTVCERLMLRFGANQNDFVQSWNNSEQAISQLLAFAKGHETSTEQLAEIGWLTNMKLGPRSDDSLNKLRLLEFALQRMARSKAVQETRLTKLL